MQCLRDYGKAAILCGRRRIDYGQLMAATEASAASLRGLPAGSRVAILGANCPEWAVALEAIWRARLTAVPIDFMSTPKEIAFILGDCAPGAVWCGAESRAKLDEALALLPSAHPQVLSLADIAVPEPGVAVPEFDENPSDDLALIIYTSGTTGNPKGVMLTFGNMEANIRSCSSDIQVYVPEDRVLVILPLHHAYPLLGSLVLPLTIGATAVFAEEMKPEAIMAALQDHACTFIVAVPRLLSLFRDAIMGKVRASAVARALFWLCSRVHSLSLSRLVFRQVQQKFGGHIRYIASGGAAAGAELIRDFRTLGFEVLEGYGMTETSPMISFSPPGHVRPGSVGKPIPGTEIRIVDGEVLVRGANVTKGYYNRPEETAATIDADGWLHTGDLGDIDADGYIRLTGRSKELIILANGKNIQPAELEAKLMDYADGLLAECAVVDDGAALVALLVPDMKTLAARRVVNIEQTLHGTILEPYNEHQPSYKRIPRMTVCPDPLPRTRLGKLRRHELRKTLEALRSGQPQAQDAAQATPAPDLPEYAPIREYLELAVGRPVGPDEHFELGLAIDSLGKLSLVSFLHERFHGDYEPSILAEHTTPRELAQFLHDHPAAEQAGPNTQTQAWTLHRPAWTHGLLNAISGFCLRRLSRITVSGMENLPDGPCIIAPNHQSFLDAFYLCSRMKSARLRKTYFYAVSKFVSGRFMKRFARRHNIIPMDINGDLRQSLGSLAAALRQGCTIAIFPEGMRSMDGRLNDFRLAFAKLALENHVPVVPVAIRGAFDVLPRFRRLPRWGKPVSIDFLKPISADAFQDARELADATREAIRSILGDAADQPAVN